MSKYYNFDALFGPSVTDDLIAGLAGLLKEIR